MVQYTLLFTDARGKQSVLNIQGDQESVTKYMTSQIDELKSRLNGVNVSSTGTVSTTTLLPGYLYNSYKTEIYGTFTIVELVESVVHTHAPTPAAAVVPAPTNGSANSANPYVDVLAELSTKLKARQARKIPFAPPMPRAYVCAPVKPVYHELVAALTERRRQIEGC